jgi:hypothetical protein
MPLADIAAGFASGPTTFPFVAAVLGRSAAGRDAVDPRVDEDVEPAGETGCESLRR